MDIQNIKTILPSERIAIRIKKRPVARDNRESCRKVPKTRRPTAHHKDGLCTWRATLSALRQTAEVAQEHDGERMGKAGLRGCVQLKAMSDAAHRSPLQLHEGIIAPSVASC